MITEKVYRDLGAAVVRAFIKSGRLDDTYSTIKVSTQRTDANEGKIAFFVENTIRPTAWLSTAELKAIAKANEVRKQSLKDEDVVRDILECEYKNRILGWRSTS